MQNELVVAAKSHATALTEHLARYGIKIKRTQAIEIIANLQGQADWNRVRDKLQEAPVRTPKPAMPASNVECSILLGRSGMGKTEALKTLLELDVADDQMAPLFICLGGGAHTYNNQRDNFGFDLNQWSITYNEEGIVSTTELTAPGIRKGYLVNFISEAKGIRDGLKEALVEFLSEMFPTHFVSTKRRLGFILLDEFNFFSDESEREIFNSLAALSKALETPPRGIVLACQKPLCSCPERLPIPTKYIIEGKWPHAKPENATFSFITVIDPNRPWLDWSSLSISDPKLIEDVYRVTSIREWDHPIRQNGDSRLVNVHGTAPWFKDLRNALLNLR